jgi:hypothetical protein
MCWRKRVSEQLDVLLDVASRFDAAAIPYMVSGLMAMNYYAQPRMTRDIDLVVEMGNTDAARIEKLSRRTITWMRQPC